MVAPFDRPARVLAEIDREPLDAGGHPLRARRDLGRLEATVLVRGGLDPTAVIGGRIVLAEHRRTRRHANGVLDKLARQLRKVEIDAAS